MVQDTESIEKNISPLLTKQFQEYLSKEDLMTGNNLLTFEVAKQYVKNFLKFEIKNIVQAQSSNLDYRILSQENKINHTVQVTIAHKTIDVKIEGFADRIGVLGSQTQLIDYKTGNVTSYDLSFNSWDELAGNPKKSKALQVALYGYVYLMQNPEVNDFVSGIYSFRNLQSGLLQLTCKRNQVTAEEIRKNFPKVIESIVQKMLSPLFTFQHNEDAKYCNYCD